MNATQIELPSAGPGLGLLYMVQHGKAGVPVYISPSRAEISEFPPSRASCPRKCQNPEAGTFDLWSMDTSTVES
jgi:hypothetical protein